MNIGQRWSVMSIAIVMNLVRAGPVHGFLPYVSGRHRNNTRTRNVAILPVLAGWYTTSGSPSSQPTNWKQLIWWYYADVYIVVLRDASGKKIKTGEVVVTR